MTAITAIQPDLSIEIFEALSQSQNIELQAVVDDFHAGVAELRTLIEDGAIIHCPTSQGKDSTVVELMAIEAYRQAVAAGTITSKHPLILSTVDTGGEQPAMKFYVQYAKRRIEAYAKACGINLRYDIVMPPVNDQFYIKWIGSQKLIPNASRHGDCSIILKVDPSHLYVKRLVQELSATDDQYRKTKVISCVGSRSDESTRRAQNMVRQGIASKGIEGLQAELQEVTIGNHQILKFAPIKHWKTEAVFDALRLAGSRPLFRLSGSKGIPGFLPDFSLLLEIYGNGGSETCEVSIGSTAQSGCNGSARFGCVFCPMVGPKDHSSTALASLERWRVLGADSALRVRDYLFRLSTSVKARAFHARAYDPTGFNRVALQPNTLQPRYLEKLVRYASQLTVDSIRAAAAFKALVDAGRELEHPGYREIAEDPFMPPKTKKAYLEMYRECAQDPKNLNWLFSEEHALLLSFRWSLDGIGASPYRPLAIWRQISAGQGWIPYPALNSELNTPVTLNPDMALPEAVMFPILKGEDPKHFALNPFNLLDLWQRPADLADLYDEERNCTVTRQADHLAELTATYNQAYSVKPISLAAACEGLDIIVHTPEGEAAFRVTQSTAEITSVLLDGKVIRGKASAQLQSAGLMAEIDELFKAKIGSIQLSASTLADAKTVVDKALSKMFAGEQRVGRKVKHLRKTKLFAGYSATERKAAAAVNFTKRVTKMVRGKAVKGNTRLSFYGMQLDSRLHLAKKQEVSLLVPDFASHTEKFIGTHDAGLYGADTLENILVEPKALQKWKDAGGLERAIALHDEHLNGIIKKRHIRGHKVGELRQYGGTHVAELMLAEGVISIEKGYWAQLKAILKRTHIFDSLGLFSFQSQTIAKVQSHHKAITMAQHRKDKAQVLLHIRAYRNAQRRAVKTGGMTEVISNNLTAFKNAAMEAVNLITHGFNADALKLTFNTSDIAPRTKADVASLWLALYVEPIESANDLLATILPPAQMACVKADPTLYLDAIKACTELLTGLQVGLESAMASWAPLLTGIKGLVATPNLVREDALACYSQMLTTLKPSFMENEGMTDYWQPSLKGFEQQVTGKLSVIEGYQAQLEGITTKFAALANTGAVGVVRKMSLHDKLALLRQRKAA